MASRQPAAMKAILYAKRCCVRLRTEKVGMSTIAVNPPTFCAPLIILTPCKVSN